MVSVFCGSCVLQWCAGGSGARRVAERVVHLLWLRWQADRFNINSQLEHLQMKYVGTGHADASKLCEGAP